MPFKDPAQKREYDRRRYAEGGEAARRRSTAWRLANPERVREADRLKHRRRMFGRRPEDVLYDDVVLVADPCAYCGKPAGEIDHIVPVADGGEVGWENHTAACRSCNAKKNRTPLLLWMVTRDTARLS